MLDFGIDRERFLEHFFEKNVFFKKRAVQERLIDWKTVSEILYAWDPADPQLKLFKNGFVSQSDYIDRFQDVQNLSWRINKEKFESYLGSGGTLVLDRIEKKALVLGALCLEISNFVCEKTVANGYVAFGGDGTFGKHWDTHDVFAVQLIGKKRWVVFRPTFDLPLEIHKSRAYQNDCPKAPVFDAVLEAGDVLYIPRGWWHEAIPIEGQDTFHIAAGVHTAKTIDYLNWLCGQVIPAFIESRKTIKKGANNTTTVAELSEVLSRALLQPDHIDLFVERMQELGNYYRPIELERLAQNAVNSVKERGQIYENVI